MKPLIRFFFLGLAIAFVGLAAAENTRPNIILVTADDLGLQLGCYGDRHVRTPRLDGFAATGVRFTHAYVTQSSCSPSRSSLLTGLYPHENGQIGLENRGYTMARAFPTLPTLLHQAGYRTGIVGKLHVAPRDAFHFDFDRTASPNTVTRERTSMRALLREFLGSSHERPFFLMVNYFDPHVPFVEQIQGLPAEPRRAEEVWPWAFQGNIDSPEIRARIAAYLSCVERLDTLCGDLLDEVAAQGHEDNTVVIFVSDNGPPFTRAKATELDAGVHVPLLVRWPGRMRPGAVANGLVSGVDVFATALDAADVPLPAGSTARSLRPLLHGSTPADWRTYVATEFTSHQPFAFLPRRSVTDGNYRLIRNLMPGEPNGLPDVDSDVAARLSQNPEFAGSVVRMIFDRHLRPPPLELYDLRSDPHCLYNMADEPVYAEVRQRLEAALHEWSARTQDPLRFAEDVEKLRARHRSVGGDNWDPRVR